MNAQTIHGESRDHQAARRYALWSNPANWRWYCIYYCEEDERLMVPKCVPWLGWTINYAHPYSGWTTAGLLAGVAAVGVALVAFFGAL